MMSDSEYYKEMYLTMLRAAEVATNWILDDKDPLWAAHILMQATMECENIYANEELPTPEQKEVFHILYEDFLSEKNR